MIDFKQCPYMTFSKKKLTIPIRIIHPPSLTPQVDPKEVEWASEPRQGGAQPTRSLGLTLHPRPCKPLSNKKPDSG